MSKFNNIIIDNNFKLFHNNNNNENNNNNILSNINNNNINIKENNIQTEKNNNNNKLINKSNSNSVSSLSSKSNRNKIDFFSNSNNNNNDKNSFSISKIKSLKRNSILQTEIIKILTKNDILTTYVKEELEDNPNFKVKNSKLLYYYLEQIPEFNKYLLMNNLKKKTILNVFEKSFYKILNKNEILFKQGDEPDNLYLILSGKIGFLSSKKIAIENNKKYNNNKKNKETKIINKEVNTNSVGEFFGEWGLMFKIKRTVTAIAKEEKTILLGISNEIFENYFSRYLIQAENYRINFIKNHILPFKYLNNYQFDIYYREIKKIFLSSKEIIYKAGKKSNEFFLIYKGNCFVKKNKKKIVILEAGDIIGFEALFGKDYEFDLESGLSGTILFKFVLSDFNEIFIERLKFYLKNFYEKQNKIFEMLNNNHVNLGKKINEKYKNIFKININNKDKCRNLNNNNNLNNNENLFNSYEKSYDIQQIENMINDYKIDNNKNFVNSKNMIKTKTLLKLNNNIFNNYKNNINKNKLYKSKLTKLNFPKIEQNINTSRNHINTIINKYNIENNNNNYIQSFFNNSNDETKFFTNKTNRTEDISYNNINEDKYIKNNNNISKDNKNNNDNIIINSYRNENRKNSKIKYCNILNKTVDFLRNKSDNKINNNSKFNIDKNKNNKDKNNISLNTKINNIINKWKKIKLNKNENFNTKRFKFPLFTVLDKNK